ncbi:MAG: NAD(P)H-hydrate dehydratase [Novosphingobium sp.]
MPADQILTAAQMRSAEGDLIAAGSSVDALMQVAGRGAADWVWRAAAGRPVSVLCGPGNNGGDGYVIAEALRERGGAVAVIAAVEPSTDAARNARALYRGEVMGPDATPLGVVLVDCLFGSGLVRALAGDHVDLLTRLAATHPLHIAIDLPSGVETDSCLPLNPGLPDYHLTLALGAWKYAHFLMPGAAGMGALRLVEIGVGAVPGAAKVLARPCLYPPASDAHKYRRGLLGVIGGAMPGAALLACRSAQGAGAGYVKLLGGGACNAPPDIVVDAAPLVEALKDPRFSLLVGPGLRRDAAARETLSAVLTAERPTVLDADALILLRKVDLSGRRAALIATPHEGELAALEAAFSLSSTGTKPDRARALAQASGMVIVAKGPDSVIAAPDGRTVLAPRASSWLSTAGTGDVLAGAIASRLANGADAFSAACQGLWLHTEAARLAGAAFTASKLAGEVARAYAACL